MLEERFEGRRRRMIERQLRARGITDERVLGAFAKVPRERFVTGALRRELAYLPVPIGIGAGQTLSQPWIVAHMLQLAAVAPGERVLDVGAGCGYQTALLATLCEQAFGVEIVPELATRARATLRNLGLGHATIAVGDGNQGLPAHAPYDAILVGATAERVPEALLAQLAEGGRLLLPVGPHMSKHAMAAAMLRGGPPRQRLHRITRSGARFEHEPLDGVYFVPFVGAT